MSVIIEKKRKQLAPVGMHAAYLVLVVNAGTQEGKFGPKKRVILGFELSGCKTVFKEENGEEPFMLSNTFNHSLDKKSSFVQFLKPWIGGEFAKNTKFDVSSLLGKPCYANVVHDTNRDGDLVAIIIGVMPIPSGTAVPEQALPSLSYSVEDGFNDVFSQLPTWIQDKIKASEEIAGVRPTAPEIIERNVRQATANVATAIDEEALETAATGAAEEAANDGVFDLDAYSDKQLRDPRVESEIREIIEDLTCSNAEKANQYRYLNQLVRRAKANAPDDLP
jgi:hypothetical protein